MPKPMRPKGKRKTNSKAKRERRRRLGPPRAAAAVKKRSEQERRSSSSCKLKFNPFRVPFKGSVPDEEAELSTSSDSEGMSASDNELSKWEHEDDVRAFVQRNDLCEDTERMLMRLSQKDYLEMMFSWVTIIPKIKNGIRVDDCENILVESDPKRACGESSNAEAERNRSAGGGKAGSRVFGVAGAAGGAVGVLMKTSSVEQGQGASPTTASTGLGAKHVTIADAVESKSIQSPSSGSEDLIMEMTCSKAAPPPVAAPVLLNCAASSRTSTVVDTRDSNLLQAQALVKTINSTALPKVQIGKKKLAPPPPPPPSTNKHAASVRKPQIVGILKHQQQDEKQHVHFAEKDNAEVDHSPCDIMKLKSSGFFTRSFLRDVPLEESHLTSASTLRAASAKKLYPGGYLQHERSMTEFQGENSRRRAKRNGVPVAHEESRANKRDLALWSQHSEQMRHKRKVDGSSFPMHIFSDSD